MSRSLFPQKLREKVVLAVESPDQRVPFIGAVGRRNAADEMIRCARRYGIPVEEDVELTAELEQLPVLSEIPEPCYRTVSSLLVKHRRG